MRYAAVYDLLAVLIFSAATAFCATAWGRSGRREMQSAGFFCAALTVDAAFSVGQSILGCSYSTSSVALTAMLAFTVLEIYFLGRTVYSVFGESVDGTFYIWLCIVVIFIGLLSTAPLDLYLCDFLAYVASILILCGIYWHLWAQADGRQKARVSPVYHWLIAILFILACLAMAYSVVNLCLFQTAPTRLRMSLYTNGMCLVTALGFIQICQREHGVLVVEERPAEAADDTEVLPETGEAEAPLPPVVPEGRLAAFCESHELTAREQEILRLLLAGKSNQEISDELYITIGTVKAHIHSIFGKLEIARRGQLLTCYMDWSAREN